MGDDRGNGASGPEGGGSGASPARSRVRTTPDGPVRLTPTEMRIIDFIRDNEGRACSKACMAAALGRSEKTVGRLLSRMRKNGLIVSEAVHAENGAQLANIYRLTEWAGTDRGGAS